MADLYISIQRLLVGLMADMLIGSGEMLKKIGLAFSVVKALRIA